MRNRICVIGYKFRKGIATMLSAVLLITAAPPVLAADSAAETGYTVLQRIAPEEGNWYSAVGEGLRGTVEIYRDPDTGEVVPTDTEGAVLTSENYLLTLEKKNGVYSIAKSEDFEWIMHNGNSRYALVRDKQQLQGVIDLVTGEVIVRCGVGNSYDSIRLMDVGPYAIMIGDGNPVLYNLVSGAVTALPNNYVGDYGDGKIVVVASDASESGQTEYLYWDLEKNAPAFDGTYWSAGPFSEGYAGVWTVGTTPTVYYEEINNTLTDEYTLEVTGEKITASLVDPNLQPSYVVAGQMSIRDEYVWEINFHDDTSGARYMIGTRSPQTTGGMHTLMFEEMESVLEQIVLVNVGDPTVEIHEERSKIGIPTVELDYETNRISWSISNSTDSGTYVVNPDTVIIDSAFIGRAEPIYSSSGSVFQIIDGQGNVAFSDDDALYSPSAFLYECIRSNGLIAMRDPETWKIGYINEAGEIQIPQIYTTTVPFYNGYARVSKTNDNGIDEAGLIDTTGATVIEFGEYDDLSSVSEDGRLWGVKGNVAYLIQLGLIDSLPSAVRYVPYSYDLSNLGRYQITGASGLPSGLALSGGLISGVPSDAGMFEVTLSTAAGTLTFSLYVADNEAETVRGAIGEGYVIEQEIPDMTSYSNQDFVIDDVVSDGRIVMEDNFDRLLDVYLDGRLLRGGKLDAGEQASSNWEYYARRGSTVITILAQTFQSAGTGDHTVAATFKKVNPSDSNTVDVVAQNYTATTTSQPAVPSRYTSSDDSDYSAPSVAVTAPTRPAETSPEEIPYAVSGNTAILQDLSDAQLRDFAASARNSKLTIDVTGKGEAVTEVEFPAGLVEQLAQLLAGGENTLNCVSIILSTATVDLDDSTLSAIAEQAGDKNVVLSVEETAINELSTAQREALAGMNAEKIISAEITAGDMLIESFAGGRVTLSMAFAAPAGREPRGYVVRNLAMDGSTTLHSTELKEGNISFRVAHFSDYIITYEPLTDVCADVADDAWYTSFVDYVFRLGLMNGISKTKFGPNTQLTRAMFAQIIYNAEKGTSGSPARFTDVADNAWYASAVNWAAQAGVVDGIGDKMYGPETSITREQMMTMLYNYAVYKGYDLSRSAALSTFPDGADISSWAQTAMEWAIGNKLVGGMDGKLTVAGNATRAQVAKILSYFFEEYGL